MSLGKVYQFLIFLEKHIEEQTLNTGRILNMKREILDLLKSPDLQAESAMFYEMMAMLNRVVTVLKLLQFTNETLTTDIEMIINKETQKEGVEDES